jgi:hypothetical protein
MPEEKNPEPKRFHLRQKISAYRITFMQEDGTVIDGEKFESVTPMLDFSAPTWFDESGRPVIDEALSGKLFEFLRKS